MPVKNHVHKYYRNPDSGLWHCALCTHYMPSNMGRNPVIGHDSHCWNCDKMFTLAEDDMDTPKPICYDCSRAKREAWEAKEREMLLQEYAEWKGTLEAFNSAYKCRLTPDDVAHITKDSPTSEET